jgi:hypothetical protein
MFTRRAVLLAALLPALSVAAPSPAEQARIDALIAGIEAERELGFVRNGRVYTSAEAARFLREKQRAMGAQVLTAEDFIERIASRSSTTGRSYLIRGADGREQPAADYLRARLGRP